VSLAPRGVSYNIIGAASVVVTDVKGTTTLGLSKPKNEIVQDYHDSNERIIMIPTGRAGPGTGLIITIGSGVMRMDPNLRDDSGELIGQALEYGMGQTKYENSIGDVPGVPSLTNALFSIALAI
jgi:hypothetical protein